MKENNYFHPSADLGRILQLIGEDYEEIVFADIDNNFIERICAKGYFATFKKNETYLEFVDSFTRHLSTNFAKEISSFLNIANLKKYKLSTPITKKIEWFDNLANEEWQVKLYPIKKTDNSENDGLSQFLLTFRLMDDNSYGGQESSENKISSLFTGFGLSFDFSRGMERFLEKISNLTLCDSCFYATRKNTCFSVDFFWSIDESAVIRQMKQLPLDYYKDIEDKLNGNEIVEVVDNNDEKKKSIFFLPVCLQEHMIAVLQINHPLRVDLFMGLSGSCILSKLSFIVKKELQTLALTVDSLTGLDNLLSFRLKAKNFMQNPPQRTYLLIKFDIRDFDAINSFYGYRYGNTVLKEVAEYIKKQSQILISCREENSDNFYCFVDEDIWLVQDLIWKAVDEFLDENNSVHLNFSFGLYKISSNTEKFDDMHEKVNLALSRSSLLKNNRVQIYSEQLVNMVNSEKQLLNDFTNAIENHEFFVLLQPKIRLSTNSIYAAEAFVRWNHQGNVLLPEEFIPILERNQKISILDRYVLNEVLQILVNWMEQEQELIPISINLSKGDFFQERLFESFIKIIDSYHIPHQYIQFEIKESNCVEQHSLMTRFTQKCDQAEIGIIMDDFGKDYSSLTRLKDFNVSEINMNYSYLYETKSEHKKNSIVSSLVDLCHGLNIRYVIKGIENEEDGIFINQLGINYVQGYYFGKPLPIAEFNLLPRQAHFLIKNEVDSSLLSEFFNSSSTFNRLFYHSFLQCGVFNCNKDKMQLVIQNRQMANSLFMKENKLSNGYHNFWDYILPEDKNKIQNYYQDVMNHNCSFDYAYCRLRLQKGYVKVMIRASLLEQLENGFTSLLVESVPLQEVRENYTSISRFTLDQINFLFDNRTSMFFIISDNRLILYVNQEGKQMYPDVQIGSTCSKILNCQEKCSSCPFHQHQQNQLVFIPAKSSFYHISSVPIELEGNVCNLIEMCPSFGHNETSVHQLKRINNSIQNIIVSFFEVNLETGEYEKYDFKKHVNLIPYHGNYSELYHLIEKEVDPISKENMKERLTLDKLVSSFDISIKKQSNLYFEKRKLWLDITISFVVDNGARFACFYIRDASSEMQKDYDSLTGIYNRSSGQSLINHYFSNHPTQPIVFFFVDIDHFKRINDTYGHPTGDKVIVEFANLLKQLPKEFCFFTRLGGDEFVFLRKIVEEDYDNLETIQLIQQKFEKISKKLGIRISTQISVGTAMYPKSGITFEDLYEIADKRMYENKEQKRSMELLQTLHLG